MMRWEYLVIYVSGNTVPINGRNVDVQEFLDGHGQEGWELVTAAPLTIETSGSVQAFPTSKYVLHLKRELKKVKATRDVSPVRPGTGPDVENGGTVN